MTRGALWKGSRLPESHLAPPVASDSQLRGSVEEGVHAEMQALAGSSSPPPWPSSGYRLQRV